MTIWCSSSDLSRRRSVTGSRLSVVMREGKAGEVVDVFDEVELEYCGIDEGSCTL